MNSDLRQFEKFDRTLRTLIWYHSNLHIIKFIGNRMIEICYRNRFDLITTIKYLYSKYTE